MSGIWAWPGSAVGESVVLIPKVVGLIPGQGTGKTHPMDA